MTPSLLRKVAFMKLARPDYLDPDKVSLAARNSFNDFTSGVGNWMHRTFQPQQTQQEQNHRDLGSMAMLGGSALLGDTARNMAQGLNTTSGLTALASKVRSNPELLRSADTAMPILKDYARLAGDAASKRILGIPAGRFLQFAPPSGPAKDIFNHHLGRTLSMPEERAQYLSGVKAHYGGFANNRAEHILFKELMAGNPSFGFDQAIPAAKRLGLSLDDMRMISENRSVNPLSQLHGAMKALHPEGNRTYDAVVGRLARNLFAHDADRVVGHGGASSAAIRKGIYDWGKSTHIGPAAYGAAGNMVARVLLPTAAIGSAGLGLMGAKRIFNDHVKIAASADSPQSPWEIGTNAALTGGGMGLMRRGMQYRPSNLIVTTAGRIAPPISLIDVGAGHVTPANGIFEALQNHPAVRSGEFVVDKAFREMDPMAVAEHYNNPNAKPFINPINGRGKRFQKPLALQNIGQHGKNHALMMVDSGFGASSAMDHVPMWGIKPEFSVNPRGVVGFVPDSRSGNLGQNLRVLFGSRPSNIRHPMGIVSFGHHNTIQGLDSLGLERVGHYKVNPAIQNSVLDLARNNLNNPKDPTSVWNDLASRMETAGHPQEAAKIRQALGEGKHMVAFTGSSRGDYVAQRINSHMNALKTMRPGMVDKIMPVALMGSSFDDNLANSLLKNINTIRIPDTRKLYPNGSAGLFDIIDASKMHYASSGASANAEAQLSRTPMRFIDNYGTWKENLDRLARQHGIKRSPIAQMEHDIVDFDKWHSGFLNEVKNRHLGQGVGPGTHNLHFVRDMDKLIAGKVPMDRTQAAKKFLSMAEGSKARLADDLINRARMLKTDTTKRMFNRMGAGGLMAGIGGLGLVDAIKNRNNIRLGDLFRN